MNRKSCLASIASVLLVFRLLAAPAAPSEARLVIVAPENLHPALTEFVAWKQTRLPAELVSLQAVLQKTPGVDDPEKLKRFLYDQWRHGVGYALLVGDVDLLPVRYMVLDRVTPAAYDYAFYPSDLYYSDLAKADGSFEDWNAQKDSFHAAYFGEVRGEKNKSDAINFDAVDYLPDIAVGRWPVSTPEEVVRVAAKTIDYERMVLSNIPIQRRAAFLAVGGWVDSRPLLAGLASKLTNSWQIERRFYSDAGQAASDPPPTHPQVRAILEEGVGLIVHAGHGQSDGWEQCLSLRDLDAVTNDPRLPVVISAGCSTAYFAPLPPYGAYVDVDGKEHEGTDHKEIFNGPPPAPAPYQRGRFNPTGLGEQMLKREGRGAVAYFGCNTGSQPCALTLVEGFVDQLAAGKEPRLGDCWAGAIRHYYEKENLAGLKPNADWYPPSIFFQGMKFMLFGDPSLRLPENSPAPGSTTPRSDLIVPKIVMEAVPMRDAIMNLARQADLNYILDPRIPWAGPPGRPQKGEPSISATWTNTTAANALTTVLRWYKLELIANPVTTIARIAPIDRAVRPVLQELVGTDTNAILPQVAIDEVPLSQVLRKLAREAGLKVTLDLSRSVYGFEGDGVVSFRWQHVTARQALAALLDNYTLVMIQDPATGSAQIRFQTWDEIEAARKRHL